tara:strand:+ start:700 stop:1068 length:369 start_codon:yes stop_codon:yes gene_type:complete
MGMTFNQINVNDFVILLTPVMEKAAIGKEYKWTGEIGIKILTDLAKNTIDENEFGNLVRIANLMAASIPAMQENKIVRQITDTYVDDNSLEIEHIDIVVHEEEVTDSNVIKLRFDSETEGNA